MRESERKPQLPTFTAEERAEWVGRYRSSGQTQAQFAQQHGLKLSTLQWWIYGGKPKQKRTAAAFREITVSPLWPAGAWAAEVTWPSGVIVRLGVQAESAWIEALLKAVGQGC
jgi:lambda repressor-like predicted transcriptional regulator